jgi:hypothetical protein
MNKDTLAIARWFTFWPGPWRWVGMDLWAANQSPEPDEDLPILSTTMMTPVLRPIIERLPQICATLAETDDGQKIIDEINAEILKMLAAPEEKIA